VRNAQSDHPQVVRGGIEALELFPPSTRFHKCLTRVPDAVHHFMLHAALRQGHTAYQRTVIPGTSTLDLDLPQLRSDCANDARVTIG
jgi:hypothetical protein